MSKASTWLLEHRRDVYSQTGEDGIIDKILELLPAHDKWCVEFGAWDGRFLTNTRNLIEAKEYSAVLIEADARKFQDLQDNYRRRDDVITINRFVGFTEKDSLDQILGNTPIPDDFDVLSIDIDGNDYHVWQAIKRYQPKVVVIEFNPTIPTDVRFVQPPDASVNQGSSLSSLVELGITKGYELVSVLPFNAFFVKREYYERFEIESNSPHVLRTDSSYVTYLFSGFDGTVFLDGNCRLPWHNLPLKASQVQRLPRFLRKFPSNYNILEKMAFGLRRFVAEPGKVTEGIFSRVRRRTRQYWNSRRRKPVRKS